MTEERKTTLCWLNQAKYHTIYLSYINITHIAAGLNKTVTLTIYPIHNLPQLQLQLSRGKNNKFL